MATARWYCGRERIGEELVVRVQRPGQRALRQDAPGRDVEHVALVEQIGHESRELRSEHGLGEHIVVGEEAVHHRRVRTEVERLHAPVERLLRDPDDRLPNPFEQLEGRRIGNHGVAGELQLGDVALDAVLLDQAGEPPLRLGAPTSLSNRPPRRRLRFSHRHESAPFRYCTCRPKLVPVHTQRVSPA